MPEWYLVEKILDRRIDQATGTLQYLIKWRGCPEGSVEADLGDYYAARNGCTWETRDNIMPHCQEVVAEFDRLAAKKLQQELGETKDGRRQALLIEFPCSAIEVDHTAQSEESSTAVNNAHCEFPASPRSTNSCERRIALSQPNTANCGVLRAIQPLGEQVIEREKKSAVCGVMGKPLKNWSSVEAFPVTTSPCSVTGKNGNNNNCCSFGDRIPAVVSSPNSRSNAAGNANAQIALVRRVAAHQATRCNFLRMLCESNHACSAQECSRKKLETDTMKEEQEGQESIIASSRTCQYSPFWQNVMMPPYSKASPPSVFRWEELTEVEKESGFVIHSILLASEAQLQNEKAEQIREKIHRKVALELEKADLEDRNMTFRAEPYGDEVVCENEEERESKGDESIAQEKVKKRKKSGKKKNKCDDDDEEITIDYLAPEPHHGMNLFDDITVDCGGFDPVYALDTKFHDPFAVCQKRRRESCKKKVNAESDEDDDDEEAKCARFEVGIEPGVKKKLSSAFLTTAQNGFPLDRMNRLPDLMKQICGQTTGMISAQDPLVVRVIVTSDIEEKSKGRWREEAGGIPITMEDLKIIPFSRFRMAYPQQLLDYMLERTAVLHE